MGHPTDIGVSMRREVLDHKLRDGKVADGKYCYWTLQREVPDGVGAGSRLYVANGGRWVGFFFIHDEGMTRDEDICFYSESFVRKDGGPRRPFRGYTFKVPSREVG